MDESETSHGQKFCDSLTKPRFKQDKEDKLKILVQSMLIYEWEMKFAARMTPYNCKLKYSNVADCKMQQLKPLFIIWCLYFGAAIL